jgi:hypothetical protein
MSALGDAVPATGCLAIGADQPFTCLQTIGDRKPAGISSVPGLDSTNSPRNRHKS